MRKDPGTGLRQGCTLTQGFYAAGRNERVCTVYSPASLSTLKRGRQLLYLKGVPVPKGRSLCDTLFFVAKSGSQGASYDERPQSEAVAVSPENAVVNEKERARDTGRRIWYGRRPGNKSASIYDAQNGE